MRERPGNKRPVTISHNRGAWLQKGERVEAGVPKVLPPLPRASRRTGWAWPSGW